MERGEKHPLEYINDIKWFKTIIDLILGPLLVPINEYKREEEAVLGDRWIEILEKFILIDNHVIEETFHHH